MSTPAISSEKEVLFLINVIGGACLLVLVLSLFFLFKSLRAPKFSVLASSLSILFISLSLSVFFVFTPKLLDARLNRVISPSALPTLSSSAIDLHKHLFVCDLHADTLLWPQRDLLSRLSWGHIDLPRLLDGNVAIQAFTIVTGTPRNLNFHSNPAPSLMQDSITLKAAVERWGWSALSERVQRTLFQTRALYQLEQNSHGQFTVLTSRRGLQQYIERRQLNPRTSAGFLGIEGLHALDDNLTNVDVLYRAGVRMMAPTHFFDNALGGSSAGVVKGGITEFGRQVIKRMHELGIILDVAHASEALIDDIVSLTSSLSHFPIITSHTGVKAVCDSPRNLADRHIRDIAARDGLIGVAFFQPEQCGAMSVEQIVKSIRHVADLVGVKHVALGSDYDGAVTVPFDASQLPHLTAALIAAKFTTDEVALIMGGNVKNFLLQYLPAE